MKMFISSLLRVSGIALGYIKGTVRASYEIISHVLSDPMKDISRDMKNPTFSEIIPLNQTALF